MVLLDLYKVPGKVLVNIAYNDIQKFVVGFLVITKILCNETDTSPL